MLDEVGMRGRKRGGSEVDDELDSGGEEQRKGARGRKKERHRVG